MDSTTHERFAGVAAISAYAILFIGGNIIWTTFCQEFLHIRAIHCPLFLLTASFSWFPPLGLVLSIATRMSWIPSDSYLAVHFGTGNELLGYLIVPMFMAARVAVQMYCRTYNSVIFNTACLMMLPAVVLPLDLCCFPRPSHFSVAKVFAIVVVCGVGSSLIYTVDSSSIGRLCILVACVLLLCEHGLEHYLQVQSPVGISDTAMTLIRNLVGLIVAAPAFFFSGELEIVQSLSFIEIRAILLASLSVVAIAFGLTGLTGRISLTVFFLVKSITSYGEALVAKLFLGEGSTLLQLICLLVLILALAIYKLPDDNVGTDLEMQPISGCRCKRYPNFVFENNHFVDFNLHPASYLSSDILEVQPIHHHHAWNVQPIGATLDASEKNKQPE